MVNELTIFKAKEIITMNPSMPRAECVVVKQGRIVCAGPESIIDAYPGARIEDTFADDILVPGFVEAHCHAMEGSIWKYLYCGFFPRYDPNKTFWSGVESYDALISRIQEKALSTPIDEPIICWGFDPIYFSGDALNRTTLDTAGIRHSVVVIHASFHVMTINSAMIESIDAQKLTSTEGVTIGDDGYPTGELLEMAAMGLVFELLGECVFNATSDPESLRQFGQSAKNAGITTITDLLNPLKPKAVETLLAVSREEDYPVRLVPAMSAHDWSISDGVAHIQSLKEQSEDKLHFGLVKMMTDGSIQGYTARLMEPGYHDGHDNGIWNVELDHLDTMINQYHQAGADIHVHTNGDEAVQVVLESIEQALIQSPRSDHRHTMQHCQIINHAQMKRVAKANICLNIFANHIYYWGDVHKSKTIGYERAQRLEPLQSSLNNGIVTAIHSDAPVTPLGPLFSMWCAVNRQTSSGDVLGDYEKVTPLEALAMVTLNAAYTLRLDHAVGSIEAGKYADFAVLDANPLAVSPEKIVDIAVKATVVGGQVFN
ncbi:amidohydrolase [Vibrio sp. 10N.286.49.B3]|uniref:amidohydrolase n=1 Tax=Vibrio sp. 10N.286.49.B3 TaxID=1880855 RepID=UPI000C823C6C|nr:amidohydrolase [Vibrio sp. 10N.286.49.B3]PMH42221.1 amidohydrolase [Vibrio sp. 10N.286.49.B3]